MPKKNRNGNESDPKNDVQKSHAQNKHTEESIKITLDSALHKEVLFCSGKGSFPAAASRHVPLQQANGIAFIDSSNFGCYCNSLQLSFLSLSFCC